MNFFVDFRAKTSLVLNSDELKQDQIGLDGLKFIRDTLDLPNLSYQLVNDWRGRVCRPEFKMEINEAQASLSGLYATTNTVFVLITGTLNPFIKDRVETETEPKNGQILSARIARVVDEKDLFTAWEAAGFPTEWTPANAPS